MKDHVNKRVIAISLIAALAIFVMFRLWTNDSMMALDSGSVLKLGTWARIRIRSGNPAQARHAQHNAFEAIDLVDRLMSTYRDDSELAQVNQSAHKRPVAISRQTYDILAAGLEYSRITDGAFDMTVAPLIALWKHAADENRLPTAQELDQAAACVGYSKVILSSPQQCTVRFSSECVQVNVDAFAKGHAVDMALQALKQAGMDAGLIEIGGEIACFTTEKSPQPWLIGIQDPFASTNDNPLSQKPSWLIKLNNCSVATSGNYRHYATIANKRYSHIIDPRTGQPAEKLPSVTVIAPKTVDADALATAVSVMGVEKGLALIESLDDTEALLITGSSDNSQLHLTGGFDKYLVSP